MSLPISKLTVVNQALIELGRQPVSTIDTDDAKLLAAKTDLLFPLLLKVCDWRFAIKYVSNNTPLTTNFSPDFTYTYQLPPDYGRMIVVGNNASLDLYELVDGYILTNMKPVTFYYVVNNVDYSVISLNFLRALALYVASDTALVLTHNEHLTQYLRLKYETEKSDAILLNNMERYVRTMPYNDFDRIVYV